MEKWKRVPCKEFQPVKRSSFNHGIVSDTDNDFRYDTVLLTTTMEAAVAVLRDIRVLLFVDTVLRRGSANYRL